MAFARSVAVAILLLAAVAVLAPTPHGVEAEQEPIRVVAPATVEAEVPAAKAVVRSSKTAKTVLQGPAKLPLLLPAFAPVEGSLDPRIRAGYEVATAKAEQLWPRCSMRWTILAGVGSVESANATHHADAVVVSDSGLVLPRILGPVLDGSAGHSRIADTDAGLLDGDVAFDRAVGPMQFIPSTWKRHGRDANGDGVADPHSIDDAALAAASYLCVAGDLDDEETLRRALFSYNHSDDYVTAVRHQIEQFDLEFGLRTFATLTEPPAGTTTIPFSVAPPAPGAGGATENSTTSHAPGTTGTTTTSPPTTKAPSSTTTSTAPTTTVSPPPRSTTTTTTTTIAPTTTTSEAPTTEAPAAEDPGGQ